MSTRISMSVRQAVEFHDLHPMLVQVVEFLMEGIWPVDELFVTSIYRTREENMEAQARTQIHVVGPPYRALDARITTFGDDYQHDVEKITAFVNRAFRYDPARPRLRVAVSHKHGSGPHLHLQVHDATIVTRLEHTV